MKVRYFVGRFDRESHVRSEDTPYSDLKVIPVLQHSIMGTIDIAGSKLVYNRVAILLGSFKLTCICWPLSRQKGCIETKVSCLELDFIESHSLDQVLDTIDEFAQVDSRT